MWRIFQLRSADGQTLNQHSRLKTQGLLFSPRCAASLPRGESSGNALNNGSPRYTAHTASLTELDVKQGAL